MEGHNSRTYVVHGVRLNHCLQDMQDIMVEQEALLNKLRASSSSTYTLPSIERPARLHQLRALKTSYESLTTSEIQFPYSVSPLPALLALRNLYRIIQEITSSLEEAETESAVVERRVQKEEADLNDAKIVTECLKIRATLMRMASQKHMQKSPSHLTHEMMRKLNKEKARYDTETGELIKALNSFIDTYLAAMLAAEEMGGPVVGEMLSVDDLTLEAGFNTKGRVKTNQRFVDKDRRQLKIDKIWSNRTTDLAQIPNSLDERQVAAAEVRELIEELLNQAVDVGGRVLNGYVQMRAESAAARFLVRSKVAQFHPKDAGRLRLVDFGRSLDE